MSLLDQTKWPEDISQLKTDTTLQNKLPKWLDILRVTPNSYKGQHLVKDFNLIIEYLVYNPEKWCAYKSSSPSSFWLQVLHDFNNIPRNFAYLLKATLSVAFGSADAERVFSQMNLIKHKTRNKLGELNLDHLVRIKMSKEDYKTFPMSRASKNYLKGGRHRRCDD